MANLAEHNSFGFNNPNFVNEGVSSLDENLLNALDLHLATSTSGDNKSTKGDDEGFCFADDENNKYDEQQSTNRGINVQQLNNVKRRSTYAKLGAADMGVPQSPTYAGDDGRLLAVSTDDAVAVRDSSGAAAAADDNLNYTLYSDRIYETDNTYFNCTAESPPLTSNSADKAYFAEVDKEKMQNGHGAGYFYEQRVGDSVDNSPQDFRRNLAAIDQIARQGGAFQPGGGIQVRQDGDTTVVTEHRDPFSFYWQLDKIKKLQESPPPLPPKQESDNGMEEVVADEPSQIQSPDSHDSGIHVEYSRPSKPVKKLLLPERFSATPPPPSTPSPRSVLPPGWEKHEDPKGFSYYWHVDSGTVQREPPKPSVERVLASEPPRVMIDRPAPAGPPPTMAIPAAAPQQPVIVERAFKQTTTKRRVENESAEDRETDVGASSADLSDGVKLPVRFAVRSLGWTEIAEEDLTQERSSRAVNKAIVDLSTGRNDLIDNVSKWGDGKELIMELDDHDLRLMDPDTGTVLHTQAIHQIRVWGVGRDNGRDFAYVARDRNTRHFMCHVFRCDTPARTIANTLRDICKRLMLERRPNSLQTNGSASGGEYQHRKTFGTNRSNHFGDMPRSSSADIRSFSRDSFPTPMEEPKKIIRCHFLGVTQVPKATGIDILNEAVDRLVAQVRIERWILCDVSIAPSTITIAEVGGNLIAECRVRYLSFLGIGRDIKHCAFIMQTSSDSFMCYVFHVEPSAGAMAKTIEAACKLRYQKVLDAHGERRSANSQRGWGDTIRDVFGTFTGRRSGRTSSQYPR